MSRLELGGLREETINARLAPSVPERLGGLAAHLAANIARKVAKLESAGNSVEVFGPDWARENSTKAGEMHAEIIVKTYGTTYALPNKDPIANKHAIEEGDLDVYLMRINEQVTGTTCLVNTNDGRAELGRSASLGNSGNTIIQDYRILDWLTNDEASKKYHTLFTTLRSAPDRDIDDFIMRGGQAVTAHWRKMPELTVNGFGPLYLKHGSLEQFSCASLSRATRRYETPLHVENDEDRAFLRAWHEQYDGTAPTFVETGVHAQDMRFAAHYPPLESGLTHLVHADIVKDEAGESVLDAVKAAESVQSPFIQAVVPIDEDTSSVQASLADSGFQVFAYEPSTSERSPALVYGKVAEGVSVVDTYWDHQKTSNPFWTNNHLARIATQVAARW